MGRPDTVFLDEQAGVGARQAERVGLVDLAELRERPALALTCPPRSVGEAARIGTIAHWLGEQ